MQVTSGTDRIMKGKDKEVVRKMKENSELVYELNVMRKKENEYQKEKRELTNENARLRRELSESAKPTTRTQTANTGHTKRFMVSREIFSREKNATLDVSDLSGTKSNSRNLKK
jgi:regulator of replication initiation timing